MDTGETIDSLRVHVRRGLDRFCMGLYFTEYGLQETSVLIPDDADPENLESCGLMDKKSPFQVFLKAVASEIIKEKGVTKGRKKAVKEYLEILQAFAGEWVEYIRKNMRKKLQNKSSILGSPDGKFHPASPDPHHGDVHGDNKKKKGGKRGPRGPYKKRKQKETPLPFNSPTASSHNSTPSPTKKTKARPTDMETARREFEAEKTDVTSKIPEKNKRLFNQVGFAKWGKINLPAMILNPFSVPPGDIRDQWMKMFQNVVEKDRIKKMGHLVWWVGPQTDGQSSYSVVPSHGFISYEEATKKNMHELPSKIKRLLERGKDLNKQQQETMEALRILNELALVEPDDREHPRSDFMEEDYWGFDDDEEGGNEEEETEDVKPAAVEPAKTKRDDDDDEDGNQEEDEELLDDEEDLVEAEANKPVKKKKGKKRKKDTVVDEEGEEDQTEIIYDDIEEATPAPPPKKKKKKDKTKLERGKKKKKKKKSMDGGEAGDAEIQQQPSDEQQNDATMANSGEQDVEMADAGQADTAAQQQPGEDEHEADGVAALAPAISKDEALLEEADSQSAESADSDYGGDDTDELLGSEDPTASKKKSKKMKKKGAKKKGESNDDDEKMKGKGKKKKDKKKDKPPKEPKKRTKAAEQRDLEKCEEEYLPIIEELQMANEMKDASLIQQVLEALIPVAESFCASFFSEYEIPQLMKATKKVLEETEGPDLAIYKKLWNIMKEVYGAKVKLMPEGFKAKKCTKAAKSKQSDKAEDGQPTIGSAVKEEIVASAHSTPLQRPEPAVVSASQEAATPATPAVKAAFKDDARRISSGGDQQQAPKTAEKAAPAKPKPKKFSVMDFTNKKKDNKRASVGGGADKVVSSTMVGSATKRKTAPSWVTAPLPTQFDNFASCPRREDRLFAMEFLLQAAAHFPSNKGVNEESVARSLELAIYEWSEPKSNWSEAYWDKIHAIVAALTGKRELGTLIGMIMDGAFASPKSVVALSVENLEHSFEGRPLSLSGE
ncbi:expressed unknown protein [Seminavis robusta]|uniref:Uncharacterized protein n=1 Tax=Seminavis robusta TaxID=568900 RepID=A0A9N8DQ10_9STRA|nr:expressed unknown protein [Seminavis robusta]|eukprot:Sro203_g085650.1 n/a (1004) ;mRNA; f:71049-74222